MCRSIVASDIPVPISIVVEVSGARVPNVVIPNACVPNVVVIAVAGVPDVVVIPVARVPYVIVIPGVRTPDVVVIPGVRYHAARGFSWLVLAHRGWLELEIRP